MSDKPQDDLGPLILATARGEREAFRSLYEKAGPKLLGVAKRVLRRPELAEEALQEGFVKIWRNAGRFDPARGTGFTWLATIVRRVALDRIPPNRDEAELDENIAQVQPQDIDVTLAGPRLGRCLEGLQESQREAIVFAFVYGMSHAEIAERMETPLGTVKSWVRRGLFQLKECLGE